MEQIIKGIAEGAGGTYKFAFNEGYPAVVNDPKTTQAVKTTAKKIAGDENVQIMDEPIMAGEDFAFYQQEFPGTFFFLGSGNEQYDSTYSLHHPKYNIDEQCLKTGAALMAALVFQKI